MPDHLTDEQLRDEYARLMGYDLGQLFHELEREFTRLSEKWSEFQELYEAGQKRIDLLNKVASNFFYFLHRWFFEDAMLHLSRLTDPPNILGNQNLSFARLADSIPDASLRDQVRKDADRVRMKCEFARNWRNKRLAHLDLATVRNECAVPLPDVANKDVRDALKSMHELLNVVRRHYGVPSLLTSSDPWGARSLVSHLEQAVRAQADADRHWRELASGKSDAK
jgi:AbiU2